MAWKETLAKRYAVSTVNGKLAALNGLFSFLGWRECRVKPLRRQRELFRDKGRELDKGEYLRLLAAAKRRENWRLYYLMETLASTGMRVSELRFVTVQALAAGRVRVDCKGKHRTIFLTAKLCRALGNYCRRQKRTSGPVFVTRTGRPVDRSNIWREMRALSTQAGVGERKVFPHNFRHLFARAFYSLEKDMAKLADLLGHASVETTRIYIMESGAEHKRQVERLGLVI
ncbi:MAG: tyrosine-type recombinase/integrase [Evtepia gabavorous]